MFASQKSSFNIFNMQGGIFTCKTSISSSLSVFTTTLTCPHRSHLQKMKSREQNKFGICFAISVECGVHLEEASNNIRKWCAVIPS
jgi:hypothetical protein